VGKAGEDIRSIADDMRGATTTVPREANKAPPGQKTAPTIQELSLEQTETSPNPVSEGTACLPCVPAGTIVLGNPNAKSIEGLKIGDKILDIEGGYSTITNTIQRPYQGEVVVIKIPYQNKPIILTPEHPVLAIKANSCRRMHQTLCFPGKDNPHCKNCSLSREYHPEFIPASELSTSGVRSKWVKHILLMPRLKGTNDIRTIDITSIASVEYEKLPDGWIKPRKKNAHNRGRSAIAVRRYVKVDYDLMKLMGFYLAEGSVTYQRRGAQLRFDFGKHESNYAQEVVTLIGKVFGIKANIVNNTRSTLRVQILSSIVAHFFANLLGKGAVNKQIPSWVLTLPTEKQIHLIEGYWRGDGYSRREKGVRNSMSFQATTVSQQLAYSLRLILHRLGLIHNLSKRKLGASIIEGRKVNGQDYCYILSIGGPSAIKLAKMIGYKTCPWRFLQSHLAGIDESWIYLPTKSIERKRYKGTVYNIATKPSQTYTANGIIVHNCSRDHLSVTSSALSEGIRFAREKGVKSPEVLRRIRIALDELNIMERIDLAPEETAKLKGAEKEIGTWTLNQSRNLRHSITAIKDTETMEQAAAQASALTEEFMSRLWSIPEEECETCGEARESIKRFVEQKRKGIAVEVGRLSPEDKERVLKRAEELVEED